VVLDPLYLNYHPSSISFKRYESSKQRKLPNRARVAVVTVVEVVVEVVTSRYPQPIREKDQPLDDIQ
jgi:hypothetical protein